MPVKKAKTTAKKTVKKTASAAKKTAAKKTTVKKTAVTAAPKEEVRTAPAKKDIQLYKDVINWKKGEANSWEWLFIEINAGDLLTEIEAGADNMDTCCKAMLACMLEGDGFIVDPGGDRLDKSLTIRYYVDNLSPSRRSYWDVNR